MRLTFKLRFRANSGQSLAVCANHPLLGGGQPVHALPLHAADADTWQVNVDFPVDSLNGPLPYQYVLRYADGALDMDLAQGRAIGPDWAKYAAVTTIDTWNAQGFVENTFYTEPFQRTLLRQNRAVIPYSSTCQRVTHQFRVRAPLLGPGQTLCLLGGSPGLGQWNSSSPILLERKPGSDYLSVDVDLSGETMPLEYKYGVFDWWGSQFLNFESGDNRRIAEPAQPGGLVVVDDAFARLGQPKWRGAGVAIPIFSLRSERASASASFLT